MDGFLLCPFCCFFFCQRREFVFVPVFVSFCLEGHAFVSEGFCFCLVFFFFILRGRFYSLGFFSQEDFVFCLLSHLFFLCFPILFVFRLFVVLFVFPLFSHFVWFFPTTSLAQSNRAI